MQLVFIHGWGFEAGFWDALASQLPQFRQERVDLGFFSDATNESRDDEPSLLIGHSLGFVHGMRSGKNWAGWVAINSFPRFVATESKLGCAPAAVLHRMKKQLLHNPENTLTEFYELIVAKSPAVDAVPHVRRLCDGLDELRDADIGEALRLSAKPGLVLAAKNDPLVPPATSEALAGFHTQLEWHPDGGHILPQSAAPWCGTAITRFIETHFGKNR